MIIANNNLSFFSSEHTNQTNKTYDLIATTLTGLVKTGVVNLGAGHCVSMSNMVSVALNQRGIKTKILEVQLTITYHSATPSSTAFVGFSDVLNPGEVDTHVVVLTQTEPPYLIDASIPHRLPKDTFALIEEVRHDNDNKVLVNCKNNNHNISIHYREKEKQSIALYHQQSIMQRIDTDSKIFKNLNLLKILVIVALTVSGLNAIRGFYDFYSTFYLENNWGPRTLQKIDERLDTLENLMYVPVDKRKKEN